METSSLRLTKENSKIIAPDVRPHKISQPKRFSSQNSLQTREIIAYKGSDLRYRGGRTFQNGVKFTGECFKDIVGMWKTYGMFRIKSKDKERQRLRWIRDEGAWENGGRRV